MKLSTDLNNIILKLSEYVVPKINKVELFTKSERKFENISDEELNIELRRLRQESCNE